MWTARRKICVHAECEERHHPVTKVAASTEKKTENYQINRSRTFHTSYYMEWTSNMIRIFTSSSLFFFFFLPFHGCCAGDNMEIWIENGADAIFFWFGSKNGSRNWRKYPAYLDVFHSLFSNNMHLAYQAHVGTKNEANEKREKSRNFHFPLHLQHTLYKR